MPPASRTAPGDRDHGGVAMLQVHDDALIVLGPERTARAALVPGRVEHEMVDDELTLPGEQGHQRLLAFGPVEQVLLLDLHPGELTPLSTELIPQPREVLFPGQIAR